MSGTIENGIKNDEQDGATSDMKRMIKIGLTAIIYLISLLIVVAGDEIFPAEFPEWLELTMVLGAAVLVLFISYYLSKGMGMVRTDGEPAAPSTKKTQRMLKTAGVVGTMTGILLVALGGPSLDSVNAFSNNPLSPVVAGLVALILSIATIVLGFHWYRTADEHDRSASDKGAQAGIYTFAIITPVWWLGERASVLPPQEPMLVLVLVLTVCAAVYTYFRGA